MKKLIYPFLLLACANTVFAQMSASEYLRPLKPEMLKLSETEQIQVPTAELRIKLTSETPHVYESTNKPWPSWWYPSPKQELFQNYTIDEKHEFEASTNLYDFVFERFTGVNTNNFLNQKFDYNATWSGACTLWALASIYTQQPTETYCLYENLDVVPSKMSRYAISDNLSIDKIATCENKGGRVFYPGQMKSLLMLSFRPLSDQAYFYDDYIFGQINSGSGVTDIKDIYPHEFLQLLRFQLGEKNFPAIMDIDKSEAIWNHPVYKLSANVSKKDETTAYVTMKVNYVVPLNLGAGVLLRHEDMLRPLDYTESSAHFLYKSEFKGRFEGDIFILDQTLARTEKSKWVADSIEEHPDILMIPPPMDQTQVLELSNSFKASLLDSGSELGTIESDVWLDRVLMLTTPANGR